MKRILSFAVMMVLGAALAFAQNTITVSGTVLDELGQPMIGVGVVQQGTTNGTVTDVDGKYTVTVPRGADIEFSFVGYATQTIPANQAAIDLTLEPDNNVLDETVVIGYGVQRKSDVTGSISQVKSEDLVNRSITTVDNGLQGKTAGVQIITTSGAPGAETSVRVRGFSSNSDSTPLYVVDGLRTNSSSVSQIDPNDIQSIEVLKDAASAAIYGAQAGNGVILITTKKAEKGVRRISYDFQYSLNQVNNIPQVLNANEYINWVSTEGGVVDESRIRDYYTNSPYNGTDTNWADVAFENGYQARHNVSFAGANNNGSLFASVSYVDNDGPIIGKQDVHHRLAATLNADYKIFDWLKFSSNNSFARFAGSRVREGGMYSMLGSVLQMDPLTPVVYKKDQLPLPIQNIVDQGHLFLTDENGDYYSMSVFQESNNINPYIMRDGYQQSNDGINLHGTTALDFTFLKGLTFTSRIGYDFNNRATYNLQWPHMVNTDTASDYVSITASNSNNLYYQWENFANYVATFAQKHHLTSMAGMSFSQRETFGVTASIAGTGPTNLGISKLDRNYAYFANQTGTANRTVSGGEKIYRSDLSYFGRVSYDFDNKYFLQVSLRADAADLSILPLNKRWGFFPAVSAGWTVSRENFFKDLGLNKAISHLKLRGSWGQNGSIAGLGNYMYASTISSDVQYPMAATGVSYQFGSHPSSTGNYNLKWETSEQLDFGFDLRMFQDRLSFGMDWYKKETKDLIMTNPVGSASVGNTLSPLNAGNVVNTGFEFDLGWHSHIGDFNYGINANLSTLKNEVTYVYETLTRVAGTSGGAGVTTYFEKGYPIWYMRGYEYTGPDKSTGYPTFKDQNGDGLINDDDKVMIGSGIPDITYGVTLTMGWKGLDLVVFANGTSGNEINYAVPRATRNQANTLKYFYDNRWTQSNTSATYPGASMLNGHNYNEYCQSSALVFDGSYFKIKQIQLGYTLPKGLLQKIRLSNLRVYMSLDDWFLFTKYPGFDPEVSMAGNGLGLDYGQYPTTKKMVFGFNITF